MKSERINPELINMYMYCLLDYVNENGDTEQQDVEADGDSSDGKLLDNEYIKRTYTL